MVLPTFMLTTDFNRAFEIVKKTSPTLKVKNKIKDAIFNYCSMKMLALIFMLSFTDQAIAQERFSPGFYVTKSQDTVRGNILNKIHYSTQILFRTTIAGASQTLTVDDVSSFGLSTGEVYYPMKFENQANLPETVTFIRMIVEGGGIELLKYHGRYIIGSNEKGRFPMAKGKTSNATHSLKNYQTNTGIFNILFQDCPSVKAEAQNVPITDEKLSQLIKAYHNCRSLPHREFHSKNLGRVSYIGFFVGQSSSKISFPNASDGNSNFPVRSKFSTAFQPTFGVLGLHSGKGPASIFALQGELAYTKADFGSTWIYTSNVGGYQIKETTITDVDMNLVTFRAGMRITARSRRINPYLSFGLAYQRSISPKATVKRLTVINTVSDEENFEFEMKYSSLVVWAGAGLKKNVFGKHVVFVDGHYEESFMSSSGKIASLALRIGFLF